MVRRPVLQNQIQDAKNPEAARYGRWGRRQARVEVLPVEDWALPHRTVIALG